MVYSSITQYNRRLLIRIETFSFVDDDSFEKVIRIKSKLVRLTSSANKKKNLSKEKRYQTFLEIKYHDILLGYSF